MCKPENESVCVCVQKPYTIKVICIISPRSSVSKP